MGVELGRLESVVRPGQGHTCRLARPGGGDQDLRPRSFGENKLPGKGLKSALAERSSEEAPELQAVPGKGGVSGLQGPHRHSSLGQAMHAQIV